MSGVEQTESFHSSDESHASIEVVLTGFFPFIAGNVGRNSFFCLLRRSKGAVSTDVHLTYFGRGIYQRFYALN